MATPTKRTSSRDVASAVGVSQATVSYVLSGRKNLSISDETREKVIQTAKRMQYRPNRLVTGLFKGLTPIVGLIVPHYYLGFHSQIIRGVESGCVDADFVTLVSYTLPNTIAGRHQVDRLLEHRVAGIICVMDLDTISGSGEWIDAVTEERIPCVLIDDLHYSGRVDCVVSDDIGGAQLAVNHLISLGHRRIGLVARDKTRTTFRDRTTGYRMALANAGIEPDEYLIHVDATGQGLERTVDRWLHAPDPPTAIFAQADQDAETILRHVESRGCRVPDDIALVGYSDSELAQGMQLTSVSQHAEKMGALAAVRLAERINGANMAPENIIVESSLTIRKSSGGTRPLRSS